MNIWMNQYLRFYLFIYDKNIPYDESDPIALAVLCIIDW
jgi:hypothetical protein